MVLVDEYDKPILDDLTEPVIACQMGEGLGDLYSVIKGRDTDLRFAFLTGVSKFSKVSLFSGLNNLIDITLDRRYATLCGYTEEDREGRRASNRQLFIAWYPNNRPWLAAGRAVWGHLAAGNVQGPTRSFPAAFCLDPS